MTCLVSCSHFLAKGIPIWSDSLRIFFWTDLLVCFMDQILVDLKCVKVYIISTTDNVSISVGGQKEPVQSPLIKNYFFVGGWIHIHLHLSTWTDTLILLILLLEFSCPAYIIPNKFNMRRQWCPSCIQLLFLLRISVLFKYCKVQLCQRMVMS